MNTELYFGNYKMDMDENTIITFNKKFLNTENINQINTEFALSVSIPLTKNNKEILGNVQLVDKWIDKDNTALSYLKQNINPNKKIPFSYRVNGEKVKEGYAKLSSYDLEHFTFTLSSKDVDFWKRLKEIQYGKEFLRSGDTNTEWGIYKSSYKKDLASSLKKFIYYKNIDINKEIVSLILEKNLIAESTLESIFIDNDYTKLNEAYKFLTFYQSNQGEYTNFDHTKMYKNGQIYDLPVPLYEKDTLEYRSSQQKVAVFLKYYLMLMKNIDISDDGEDLKIQSLKFDSGWFNNSNPYYNNLMLDCSINTGIGNKDFFYLGPNLDSNGEAYDYVPKLILNGDVYNNDYGYTDYTTHKSPNYYISSGIDKFQSSNPTLTNEIEILNGFLMLSRGLTSFPSGINVEFNFIGRLNFDLETAITQADKDTYGFDSILHTESNGAQNLKFNYLEFTIYCTMRIISNSSTTLIEKEIDTFRINDDTTINLNNVNFNYDVYQIFQGALVSRCTLDLDLKTFGSSLNYYDYRKVYKNFFDLGLTEANKIRIYSYSNTSVTEGFDFLIEVKPNTVCSAQYNVDYPNGIQTLFLGQDDFAVTLKNGGDVDADRTYYKNDVNTLMVKDSITVASVEKKSYGLNKTLTIENLNTDYKTYYEFFTDYIKTFNLLVDYDKDGTINITDYNSYFKDYKIVDWSKKIDYSDNYNIQSRVIDNSTVSLKMLSNDTANAVTQYNQGNSVLYGNTDIKTGIDFDSEKKVVSSSKFKAPFIGQYKGFVYDFNGTDYVYNQNEKRITPYMPDYQKEITDKITKSTSQNTLLLYAPPVIFKDEDDNQVNYYVTDDFITLQSDSSTSTEINGLASSYKINTKWSQLSDSVIKAGNTIYTTYFGVPNTVEFPSNCKVYSIYDVCWKKQLEELTDPNAKILTAYFNLSFTDLNDFSFKNFVIIEGVLFHPIEIDFDYSGGLTKVKLIKVTDIKNYTKAIDASFV